MNGDPHGSTWGGYEWESWRPISEAINSVPLRSMGLYRIRGPGAGLIYVGEGLIPNRLAVHVAKQRDHEGRQGSIFHEARPLECSWVVNPGWLHHQRLELESDLIAAHVLTIGSPPVAQFLD